MGRKSSSRWTERATAPQRPLRRLARLRQAAFDEIAADPQQFLAIVRDEGSRPAGTMQLTFIPGLSRGGSKRMVIEGVRVHSRTRGSGLGVLLMEWAHEQGRARGAVLAQLTSDKRRTDAHRFYDRLGYSATHEGYKHDL